MDVATKGSDTFVYWLNMDSGDDIIHDFDEGFGVVSDTLQLNDLVSDFDSIAELDSADGLADGFSVADNGSDVTVTFGQGGGSVVIEGIGTGSIDSFADLDGAINLEINA